MAVSSAPLPGHHASASGLGNDIAPDLLEAAAQASAAQESSGESGDEATEANPDGSKPEKRKKRSRACQACRNMKIRCNPVEGQHACLACSKVNRDCVVPGPGPRKRQRTVHKVAELEKKIEALTKSLVSQTRAEPSPPATSPATTNSAMPSARESFLPSPRIPLQTHTMAAMCQVPGPALQGSSSDTQYRDVVDRGIISLASAERLFEYFLTEMNPAYPFVAFPAGATFSSLRRERPMLVLTILCASSTALLPSLRPELTEEHFRELSNRIMHEFERSLDLVQSLVLNTSWIGKRENHKQIGFNQYIHSAIVMAHDLGLTKRLKFSLSNNPLEDAEMRRAWLACYWSGACVSVILRHPPMVRNTAHIQDSIKWFATSKFAAPTDKVLCGMVKLMMILEDVATCFQMDDPMSTISIEDAPVQYSITMFERRLEMWSKECHDCFEPNFFKLLHGTGNLYIHEQAMHVDHNVDDFRPPNPHANASDTSRLPDSLDRVVMTESSITASHIEALKCCVTAIKESLDAFIDMRPGYRQLPCIVFVFACYAAISLVRLDGVLRASKSRFADIFLADLNVAQYTDALVAAVDTLPENRSKFTPHAMFLQAFQRLRVWYQYRLAGIRLPYEDEVDCPKKVGGPLPTMPQSRTNSADAGVPSNLSTGIHSPSSADYAMHSKQRSQTDPQVHQATTGNQWPTTQAFDLNGGSWLTNPNIAIEPSMFENLNWDDISMPAFEASMVQQQSNGSWLGYLL